MSIMVSNILTAFLVILLSANFAGSDFVCDPVEDCKGSGIEVGDPVPDPEDCRKYYTCLQDGIPTPSSASCDFGKYFSTKTNKCVVGLRCQHNDCYGSKTCGASCDKETTAIPYPGDCTKYYRCNDPAELVGECEEDAPYFNGERCGSNPQQCCAVCEVMCEEDHVLLVDPDDCHRYRFCDNNEFTTYSCDDGEYFNPVTEDCEQEETECSSYCPGGVPNYGTQTTTEVGPSNPSTQEKISEATSEKTSDTAPVTSESICFEEFECPVAEGNYVYCNACIKTFWECSGGDASKGSCSNGSLYDYTTNECVPKEDCPKYGP